eukprot:TRINITY_DN7922_c0_g1_i1.p1 TRINITY_DN7922_c0_g1~~TRINITY_DN7922_c0_g1_i1.p1  ORF type:complete len:155 (-),score=19.66 TRINITY_DN7922_c0_g1_i1:72-536(-)
MDPFFEMEMNQVEERLFIGGLNAVGTAVLKKYSITHVVNLSGCDLKYPQNIKSKVVLVADFEKTNIYQHFDPCHDFIDKAHAEGGVVLVHCAAGISRSCSIVCAYLMKSKKLRFQEALEKVKKARPIVCPNYGFQAQLLQYENQIFPAEEKGAH